jgi:AcrR family transcriptional regulator
MGRTTTRTAPRKRVPRAEREQQILEAAEAVFAARGVKAASMEEIAERVGVTKPLLYEYFGSKDGLVVACIRRARAELLERTWEAVEPAETAEERMRLGVLAFFDFIADHAAAWAVARGEASILGEAVAAVEEVRSQQTDYVAGVLASYPELTDAEPSRLHGYADVIVGACERLALRLETDPDLDAQGATDLVMDVIWSGLAVLAE